MESQLNRPKYNCTSVYMWFICTIYKMLVYKAVKFKRLKTHSHQRCFYTAKIIYITQHKKLLVLGRRAQHVLFVLVSSKITELIRNVNHITGNVSSNATTNKISSCRGLLFGDYWNMWLRLPVRPVFKRPFKLEKQNP